MPGTRPGMTSFHYKTLFRWLHFESALRIRIVRSLRQVTARRANQFKLMHIAPLARARNRERAQANFVREFKPIWVVQSAREK
jgi:hypothetical protein